MKKISLALLITLVIANLCTAQISIHTDCGTLQKTDEEMATLPYFGNEQWLSK
ncbi:MAG: hypothetical protein KA974_04115 [Saprospiraceae bacterium]|nr:hypothetical protein [Saprospiraceae bacterium]MBP7699887.1 hypothetical protein [Saprospiraceae bacterium]